MKYTWKLEDHDTGEITETDKYYATGKAAIESLTNHIRESFVRNELNHLISFTILDEDGQYAGSMSHIRVYQLLGVYPHHPMSESDALNIAFEAFAAGPPPFESSKHPPIKYIIWFRDGSCLTRYGTEEELAKQYGTAIKIEEA